MAHDSLNGCVHFGAMALPSLSHLQLLIGFALLVLTALFLFAERGTVIPVLPRPLHNGRAHVKLWTALERDEAVF